MRESASPLEVEEDDGETVSTTWFRVAVISISIFRGSRNSVLLIFLHLQHHRTPATMHI